MCATTKWFCDFFVVVENNKRKNSFQSSDMAETGPLLSLACVGQVAEVGKFIRFNFILESLSHLIGKETKTQRCWGKEKEEYSSSICYVLVMLTNSLLLTLHGNLVAEVSGFVSILQINI